ncbi:MAG: hypothetical protein HY905_04600 [Deltaproteobacteria bacterium]|nr:hypothetical protein [Deltaproteobacteria bacterium]
MPEFIVTLKNCGPLPYWVTAEVGVTLGLDAEAIGAGPPLGGLTPVCEAVSLHRSAFCPVDVASEQQVAVPLVQPCEWGAPGTAAPTDMAWSFPTGRITPIDGWYLLRAKMVVGEQSRPGRMGVFPEGSPVDAAWLDMLAGLHGERTTAVNGPEWVEFDTSALKAITGFDTLWPWDVVDGSGGLPVAVSNEVLVYFHFEMTGECAPSRRADAPARRSGVEIDMVQNDASDPEDQLQPQRPAANGRQEAWVERGDTHNPNPI